MTATNPYAATLDIPEPVADSGVRRHIEDALIDWMNESREPDSGAVRCRGGAVMPSVSELCARAFVARSTFYRHYHHVDEVLEGVERRLLHGLTAAGEAWSVKTGERVSLDGTLAYVTGHEREFRALLLEPADARFVESWKTAIKYHCWQRLFTGGGVSGPAVDSGERRPIADRRLLMEIVASAMVSAVTFVLREPGTTTLHDVDDIVNLALDALDGVV